MQINIDKKTGVFLVVILFLLGALFFVSTSKNENSGDGMDGHMGNMGHMGQNKKYTGADVMFLQMMIPHHQQAIDISNQAITKSKDSELIALAKKIATDQAAEIVQMKSWLKDANASEDMGHSMHDMGGMLSSDELSNLNSATGSAFDKAWLEGMIGHHEGAIHMTNMINDAQNPAIKEFGNKIVKDQSAQIDQMKSILARIK